MKHESVDKFFQDKLQHHRKAVPGAAWSRIATQLNHGTPVRKIHRRWALLAAAVLLFAIANITGWYFYQAPDTLQTYQPPRPHHTPAPPTPPSLNTIAPPQMANTAPTPQSIQPAQAHATMPVQQPTPAKAIISQPEQTPALPATTAPTTTIESTPIYTAPPTLATTTTTTPPSEKVPTSSSSFKLVIHVDEANAKYLDKNALAQATESHQKSSGIKKLLNKAYELKENPNALGSLRQMKNEILALNFQDDKHHDTHNE